MLVVEHGDGVLSKEASVFLEVFNHYIRFARLIDVVYDIPVTCSSTGEDYAHEYPS